MAVRMRRMTLQDLLREKAGLQSSTELREAIGGSPAQVSNLWYGRDTIGARIMIRILKAFPQISVTELAAVDEAAKANKPAPPRRPRRPSRDEPPAAPG